MDVHGRFCLEGDAFPSVADLLHYFVDSRRTVSKKSDCILQEPVRKDGTLSVFSFEDIEFGEQIGKGNFGDVWQGVVVSLNRRTVAIKV